MPFLTPCLGEGSPTKIDYRKKGTRILPSPLEDLVYTVTLPQTPTCFGSRERISVFCGKIRYFHLLKRI